MLVKNCAVKFVLSNLEKFGHMIALHKNIHLKAINACDFEV
jgi:hypothetical protein